MIFHDNGLLEDNSHEISYLIFSKIGKMSQNLSSAAVVIGALRVKYHSLNSDDLFVARKDNLITESFIG